MVCMASIRSSNGHMSFNFDNIHMKLSIHAYSEVCFHTTLSKYKTLYDVITNELDYRAEGVSFLIDNTCVGYQLTFRIIEVRIIEDVLYSFVLNFRGSN